MRSATGGEGSTLGVFVMPMAGVWLVVTVAESVSVTSAPVGGVPVAVAVLAKLPASMSAWVIVCVAVQSVCSPGFKVNGVAGTQTRLLTFGSLTVALVSVTLPLLVATIV